MQFKEGTALTVGELKEKLAGHDDGELVSLKLVINNGILAALFKAASDEGAFGWDLDIAPYEVVAGRKPEDEFKVVKRQDVSPIMPPSRGPVA